MATVRRKGLQATPISNIETNANAPLPKETFANELTGRLYRLFFVKHALRRRSPRPHQASLRTPLDSIAVIFHSR